MDPVAAGIFHEINFRAELFKRRNAIVIMVVIVLNVWKGKHVFTNSNIDTIENTFCSYVILLYFPSDARGWCHVADDNNNNSNDVLLGIQKYKQLSQMHRAHAHTHT